MHQMFVSNLCTCVPTQRTLGKRAPGNIGSTGD